MSSSAKEKGLEYLDDLTGLHNRRYFKERLLAEKREADRKGSFFALMMIDLDNFKPINDLHGHLTGDRVLSQVGSILKDSIRSTDTLCRYAGDEFVAILPETEETDVIQIAQRVKEKLDQADWTDDKGEPLPPVTCSSGYAFYSEAGRDLNGLIDWADQALYAVKHRGGNGYCGEKELLKRPVDRPVLTTPSIVGREKELRHLKSVMEEVREQGGTLVEIKGEAGIGKTRLVKELKQYVERRRGTALQGTCYEETRSIPYYPFREALARFFGEKRKESVSLLKSLPRYSQKELARIVPNLREHRSADIGKGLDQFRLFESVRLFLHLIGSRSPVPMLLTIEDIQWADAASIELLHYLARSLKTAPVLLCVTYRTEEKAPLVSRFTKSLRKEDLSDELTLGPLTRDAVTTILRLLLPRRKADKNLRISLYERSEGNPFFVEELLRLISEKETKSLDLSKLEIPESVSALLESRTDSLEPETREALSCGALIGEVFEFDVLCKVLGKPQSEVLTSIEQASRSHIVREIIESADHRYRFVHSLMADVLYSGIGKARRKMWHGQVGDALLEVYRGRLAQLNGRLTYHFEKAGEWEKAVTYAIRSAQQAKNAFANQEAIKLYEKARKILPRFTEDANEQTVQVSEGLGDVFQLTGDYERALEEYKWIEDFALKNEDRSREADALSKISRIHHLKGDYDEAMRYAQKSLEIRKEIGDTRAIADSLHLVGNAHWSRGDYTKAGKYYEEALAARRQLKDMQGAASSLHNIGNIRFEHGDYSKALKCYGESLAIRREAGDKRGAASSLSSIGNVHADRGDYKEALDFYEESLSLRKEIGDRRGTASTLQNIGTVHADRGEYKEALDCYQQALRILREIGGKRDMALTLNNIGIIHSNRGNYDDALLCYEDSLAMRREMGDRRGAAVTLHNIAVVHENQGYFTEALKRYKESMKIRKEVGDRHGVALSLQSMGTVHCSRGEYNKASKMLEESLNIQKEIGDKKRIASSLLSIGVVQAFKGEYSRALRNYQQALEIQNEIGHRWGIAFTMQEIGTLYQHLCYAKGAEELHRKALAIMEELGLRAERADILGRIGMDHFLSGKHKKAVGLLSEALAMTRELGAREAEPVILEALTAVWSSVGNELEARHFCDRLEAVAQERGLKRHLAAVKMLSAELLLSRPTTSRPSVARWEKPESELKEAAKIADSIGALPLVWKIRASLGELYRGKKDEKKALREFSKAKKVIDEIEANIEDPKLKQAFLDCERVRSALDSGSG